MLRLFFSDGRFWKCDNLIAFAVDSENSTNSASNTPVSSTNTSASNSPALTRSLANTPAVKFLTRPDIFTLIQNNEVRSPLSVVDSKMNADSSPGHEQKV